MLLMVMNRCLIIMATLAFGCHSYPDYVYYPNGERTWRPMEEIERSQKSCIDSLNSRHDSIVSQGRFQDVMVLVGGGVSAAGGISAAALSQRDSASATPTTVSAIVASAGAIAALASKLGADPSVDTELYGRKRKHYDAGLLVYRQFQRADRSTPITRYIISRFQSCAASDPEKDVPALPAGSVPII